MQSVKIFRNHGLEFVMVEAGTHNGCQEMPVKVMQKEFIINNHIYANLLLKCFFLYICWAQSMDLHNPWIALCKPWIRTLCGQSMDCVYTYVSIFNLYLSLLFLLYIFKSVHMHGLHKPAS